MKRPTALLEHQLLTALPNTWELGSGASTGEGRNDTGQASVCSPLRLRPSGRQHKHRPPRPDERGRIVPGCPPGVRRTGWRQSLLEDECLQEPEEVSRSDANRSRSETNRGAE